MDLYLYVKAFHVIAMVAWMAGMFYLPRLYVYHADAAPGSELSETFKLMEYRLLKIIVNPAMIATWVLGLALIFGFGVIDWSTDFWLHAKLTLVILLTVFHIFLARWRKDFAADRNVRSARFYRISNEFPTVLLIFIVILVVVKPF
ncbi:MAG: protoporphyrinogen oxidase HemJ [Rhodomicrobium sp.]|nr:protoporphyrinogen oxidase HemJ [Rhodomicrobium sp.]